MYDMFHPDVAEVKCFCRRWAELESADYEFRERCETVWKLPWRVEFYDLHRWNGVYTHWNCHDVEHGEGMTLADAWKGMADAIMEYENAASKEEALLKAELAYRRVLSRGWGKAEYAAYYRHARYAV